MWLQRGVAIVTFWIIFKIDLLMTFLVCVGNQIVDGILIIIYGLIEFAVVIIIINLSITFLQIISLLFTPPSLKNLIIILTNFNRLLIYIFLINNLVRLLWIMSFVEIYDGFLLVCWSIGFLKQLPIKIPIIFNCQFFFLKIINKIWLLLIVFGC